jgi:branched-chain amino acid transport system permease protein
VIFVLVMMFAPAGIGGLLSRNFVMVRQMRATQAVVFYAPRLMSGLLLAAAFIFLCEAGSAFISRDYVAARRVAGGQMIPARFLAASWDPLSLTTWSIPVGLAAAGLILQLATVRRRPATA